MPHATLLNEPVPREPGVLRPDEGWEGVLQHLRAPAGARPVPGLQQDHRHLLLPGPGHLPARQPQPRQRGEGVRQVVWSPHTLGIPQVSRWRYWQLSMY